MPGTQLFILPNNRSDGHSWTDATFAASGDQAHRSAMPINPTCVNFCRWWTDGPMMPQHNDTRRKCVAHNLLSAFSPFPKKSMKRKIYSCFFTQYTALSSYKFCNDQMSRHSRAWPARPWHSRAIEIMVHGLMPNHGPDTAGSHIGFSFFFSDLSWKKFEAL
jgi:hypothetical protein